MNKGSIRLAELGGFLDVAKQAAFKAGEFLSSNLDGIREFRYKEKGHGNPLSSGDKGAEDIIFSIISKAFPEHGFVSEEGCGKDTSSDYTWVIDPLDGTVNFIHKYRYFGISISLLYRQEVILGVVYNPSIDELFTAVKGNGAYLNERRIEVSKTASLDDSLVAMGFPYDRNSEAFIRSVGIFISLLRDSQAVRRAGSTAVDLCNVACGRYDGFCVTGNELWDYAAGTLIVAEAGGKVTDLNGDLFRIYNNKHEVLATNGKIHELILKCLKDEEQHK